MRRLNLYTLDMKYVRDLAKVDDKVMSVSPQLGKQRRPFVGVVLIDMTVRPNDTPGERRYKGLLNDQLDWCNSNADTISRKANRLYELVTNHPERSRQLVRRC